MKDNFYFDELENSFIGKLQILNKFIELEIKLNDSEVNWKDIKRFIESLNDDYIPIILDTSTKLLSEFIKLVPFGVSEPFNSYNFRLEAIIYHGKVNNHIFEDLVDRFELIFLILMFFVVC